MGRKMRGFIEFWLFAFALGHECRDEELGIECLDSCLSNYDECKETCAGNSSCQLDCGIDLTSCLNSCPCQTDCPTGCEQCESDFCQSVQCRDPEANEDYITCENYYNKFYEDCVSSCPPLDYACVGVCTRENDQSIQGCPCQPGCPDGCPCPEYECRTEVLILSTIFSINVPVLTNSAAREDMDLNFEIDEEAEVFASCSLTWENDLYVFGGYYKKTQISKVKSCRLEPIGQLDFNLYYGDCVNVASNKIVLCFNSETNGDFKQCRMAPLPTGAFSKITPSQFDHRYTRIATDDELIVAVGSDYGNFNTKTELLDLDGNNWSNADD